MERPVINKESLIQEYMQWLAKNGIGRNSDDLRFGQYIFNEYDMVVNGNKINIDSKDNDAFHIEDIERAFNLMLNELSNC